MFPTPSYLASFASIKWLRLLLFTISSLALPAYAQSYVADQLTVNLSTAPSIGAGAVGKTIGAVGGPIRVIEAAQTVTAGVGGFLSLVDVWVGRQSDTVDDLILSVFDTGNLTSTGVPVTSVAIPASLVASSSLFSYSMVTVDLRYANIFLNAGDSFAVSLSAPNAPVSSVAPYWSPYSWAHSPYAPYSGGSRFVRELQIGPDWIASSTADQALRTWVQPAAIPEPSISWFLVSGLLMLIWVVGLKKSS